ncbi:MAG: hypothetical protein LBQ73_07725 [Tannerellaceae bacterium]|jgi:hypothetical protein|nr:hypothetical protein [Tannerellaceae bacterium]
MKQNIFLFLIGLASGTVLFSSCRNELQRQVVCLNGEWEITKTDGRLPEVFASTTQIPGVVDLAVPSLDTVATLYRDGWYWHKRSFDLSNTSFDVIRLKIYKAKYHTKVYVNGAFAGEN